MIDKVNRGTLNPFKNANDRVNIFKLRDMLDFNNIPHDFNYTSRIVRAGKAVINSTSDNTEEKNIFEKE